MGFYDLLNEKLMNFWADFVRTLPQLGVAVLVLLLTWAASRVLQLMIGNAFGRTRMRASLRELLKSLVNVGATR